MLVRQAVKAGMAVSPSGGCGARSVGHRVWGTECGAQSVARANRVEAARSAECVRAVHTWYSCESRCQASRRCGLYARSRISSGCSSERLAALSPSLPAPPRAAAASRQYTSACTRARRRPTADVSSARRLASAAAPTPPLVPPPAQPAPTPTPPPPRLRWPRPGGVISTRWTARGSRARCRHASAESTSAALAPGAATAAAAAKKAARDPAAATPTCAHMRARTGM
eukprot:364629-Chlamydomonas_euryale.AAC.1